MTQFSKFDVSDYLNSDEAMLEYLAVAMEDENPDVFIAALGAVARARGMSHVADAAGLGRKVSIRHLSPVRSSATRPCRKSCIR